MLQLPPGFDTSLDTHQAVGLDHDRALVFLFAGQQLIQRTASPLALTPGDYGDLLRYWIACETIGSYHSRPCLAILLPDLPQPLPPGWEARNIRQWFGQLPDDLAALAMRANQLLQWSRTHRWCGACGSPTERIAGERAMQCPHCGLRTYPRISPAMMVLITRGRELLLASNVQFPPGRYSALAGFLEAGESAEAALHREVAEEVGLRVHRLRYFGSQSWAFPHSLMIAFTAEWLSGDIRIDPSEIRDARWFAPENLPDLPPARISIARALVEDTARRLRQSSA